MGEQLRNRALTDTFEPGSTMKPITVAMALEAGRVNPQTLIDTALGATALGVHNQRHPQLRRPHSRGRDPEIQQRGALKIAQRMSPHEMWDTYTALGYGQNRISNFRVP